MKRNFLVVAADGPVREQLGGDLRSRGFSVTLAASAAEAERIVRTVMVDVVIIEAPLPDAAADDLGQRLQQTRPDCRVMVMTSFQRIRNTPDQFRFGADDYLVPRRQLLELLSTSHDSSEAHGAIGQRGANALTHVIDVLVGLREIDDRCFGGSSHQAMELARLTAEELSAKDESVQEVVLATLLRDIGNAGVDEEIFKCEGELDDDQRSQLRDHVNSSVRLLEHIDFPWKILPIIRHHHEHYDGTGYPDGLRGREVPMGARIVAVVDAYVSMTSDRPHRKALDPEGALDELIKHAGQQFDPEVVEVFQRVLDQKLRRVVAGKKPRVLIADPQGDFRKLLKLRLVNQGFEVEEATSCEKALRCILGDPPDLALVDADAEPSEAFQLLAELQGDEALRRMPFVLISQRSDRLLKLRALREGVDDFLLKTDDIEYLVARIENVMTREALRRSDEVRTRRRGITGDLADMSLPDIVQTIVIGMKTACVTVSANGDQGKIWFENGTPRHSEAGELEGETAFYQLVRWNQGEFVIEHGIKCDKTSLEQDAMFLLMEGMRLMDEEAQSGSASRAS